MTDFRALCAELVGAVENYDFDSDNLEQDWSVLERARAALAQPEPEGVTLDHVNLIGFVLGREPWATWLKSGGCLESAHCEMSELLLAAITRYARPTTH